MRMVAMRLHTKDQAKEGAKETEGLPFCKWEPSMHGYLMFLVDSKLVYDTLDMIIEKPSFDYYAEFQKTGLERAETLTKDLEWFKEQGLVIPKPSSPGLKYAHILRNYQEKILRRFFVTSTTYTLPTRPGGRMIGKKVAGKVLDKKELEFYKWDGDLMELLQKVRGKLNKVAESWTREKKDHCLEETEKSFKLSMDILRLILS